MRAFWWFEENSIAGMARPGFNNVHWFDLPFDEALALGWLGQYSTGPVSLERFHHHLATYAPKIFSFYRLDVRTGPEALRVFESTEGFLGVVERLRKRTGFLDHISVRENELHFGLSQERLKAEADFLKAQGIARVVSLTESHHGRDFLRDHFSLHHIAIEDLGAPRLEQAQELAEIIRGSRAAAERLAVHCLAGIGRTSTMILSAHLLLGGSYPELMARIAQRNPKFQLVGAQKEFLESVAARAR